MRCAFTEVLPGAEKNLPLNRFADTREAGFFTTVREHIP
jgi:hypothetical protein